MDIVSYRGPCAPGGVSAALARFFELHGGSGTRWWHLADSNLMLRHAESLERASRIVPTLAEGHYRYCNEFLWPIMHDLGEYAHFSLADQLRYKQFNIAVAANLRSDKQTDDGTFFIQDYQFAHLPSLLSTLWSARSSLFWHIPWPSAVPHQYVAQIIDVAESMLHCERLGFHTDEYRNNFFQFVQQHMPAYDLDEERSAISSRGDNANRIRCQIIVQPLGIDWRFWEQQAKNTRSSERVFLRNLVSRHYVLSVDRADYTKGVIERLRAIDCFFQQFPQWRNEVQFVQACQRSRAGLHAFDRYWEACNELARTVNSRWGTEQWQPVIWLSDSVNPTQLSRLYESAEAMLVTPLRDGLNLTAKEFVASKGEKSGTLLLSPSAGVWHELGDYAIAVDPLVPTRMADSIASALAMPEADRRQRLDALRIHIQSNPLQRWWNRFAAQPIAHRSHHRAPSSSATTLTHQYK